MVHVHASVLAILSSGLLGQGEVAETPHNLALGKTYALSPTPDYVHCTDPDDALQLTDGKSTTAYFWTQKGTVGWTSARYVTVTVDLGRVEPISGAALTTAAGVAGVTWPAAIRVLVSDDGSTYRDSGDLVELDLEVHGPWPEGYAIRRLSTVKVETRGRFVRFVIVPVGGGPFVFADEVEVFRGQDALLDREPRGAVVESTDALFIAWRTRSCVHRRFAADAAGLVAAIRATDLPEASRERLLEEASEASASLDPSALTVDASFRAILPFDRAHARLFEVQAKLWRELGHGGLSAVACSPWDPLEPFASPATRGTSPIEVHAMWGESRAAAFVLFNATERPLELSLKLEGLSSSPPSGTVAIHEVQWTDTGQGRVVAAALAEAPRSEGGWNIRVLPGLPQQVWLTFRPEGDSKGWHDGRIVVDGAGVSRIAVPFRLRVVPLRFPERPRLWVGGWSYTNGGGRYGVTAANREAFVQHCRSRFVNAPWATASVLMRFHFDDNDPDTIELDTRELDSWILEWPDARAYLVFLAVAHHSGAIRTSLGEVAVASGEFERRVGVWISAWVKHLRSRGIAPERLALLIHDEPHEGSDVGPLLRWAAAIRAAEPEVRIWEDPTYRDPTGAPRELFEACDILCPNRPMWLQSPEAFRAFYRERKREGKALQFYSCSGPARLLDPYAYYRLQAWECFREGATASFFWALGDTGGASSYNEYLATAGPYTPLFLDESSVAAGKHMEAIRESVEDHETLCMLRDTVESARAAGRDDVALGKAVQVLEVAASEVLDAPGTTGLFWQDPKDRSIADAVRVRVLEALESLRAR